MISHGSDAPENKVTQDDHDSARGRDIRFRCKRCGCFRTFRRVWGKTDYVAGLAIRKKACMTCGLTVLAAEQVIDDDVDSEMN